MDWRNYTNDPLDDAMHSRIHDHLAGISASFDGDLTAYFCAAAQDKRVLHIGCFEHDEKYLQSLEWKHKRINAVASRCLGLDINRDGVELMQRLGYDAVVADATGPDDLGERFDIIIIGDVIEHLLDMGGLIDFATRHLALGGRTILSTPNPFYIGTVERAWRKAPAVANFEHTCWVSESNMLEIAARKRLTLAAIVYPGGRSVKKASARFVKKLAWRVRSTMLFTTICYELTA